MASSVSSGVAAAGGAGGAGGGAAVVTPRSPLTLLSLPPSLLEATIIDSVVATMVSPENLPTVAGSGRQERLQGATK